MRFFKIKGLSKIVSMESFLVLNLFFVKRNILKWKVNYFKKNNKDVYIIIGKKLVLEMLRKGFIEV